MLEWSEYVIVVSGVSLYCPWLDSCMFLVVYLGIFYVFSGGDAQEGVNKVVSEVSLCRLLCVSVVYLECL